MNTSVITIGVITLVLIWYNLRISIEIINYLKHQNQEVSLFNGGFFVKGKIFTYLPLYKKVTLEAEGKVGPLYYSFYVTFVLFMLSLGIGIIMVL